MLASLSDADDQLDRFWELNTAENAPERKGDVDKVYDVIFNLVNGNDPLSFKLERHTSEGGRLVLGDRPFYSGPDGFLAVTPFEQVGEVVALLGPLTPEIFAQRLEREISAQEQEEDFPDGVGWVVSNYAAMRVVFERALAENRDVLVCVG